MGRYARYLDKLYGLRISGLTAKVIVGTSVILTVCLGLFTYYDMETRTRFYSDKQHERAYEISDTVMRSIEYPMLDGEMPVVEAILHRLNTLADVTVINLCDKKGVVRHSGIDAGVGRPDNSPITNWALNTKSVVKGVEAFEGEQILRHAMPITNEKACHKCHGTDKEILGVLSVGISWSAIEERLGALRNREISMAVVSIVVVGSFLIIFLSRYITRPVAVLARLADEISRGNPGFEFGTSVKCWEVEKCDKVDCPAYGKSEVMCWYVDDTHCKVQPSGKFPEKLDMCRRCMVYRIHVGDEMVQLADSFKHMLDRLRAAEKELRQSEEKYRLLFDTEPSPIFILDRRTLRILDANARAETEYGYTREDLFKMSFADLGYEGVAQEIISSFDSVLDGRSVVFPKKLRRRKDGVLYYASIHVCVARYLGKDVLIAAITDVTESVQKEARIIQTSKMATLGEMATGVAHELNQPLSAIQLGTDFFMGMVRQGKEIPPNELYLVSEQMAEQVDRAVHIINHLREFGRKPEVQPEEIDINKPLMGVFALLGQQLKLRGINVVLDLKEGLSRIRADSNRLEQVFLNLVVNAWQAMEEKEERSGGAAPDKTLAVRSFEENGKVVVMVTDTGMGIPDALKEKIFEPFFTTKEVRKGTGLGLSISYGIVKDYNGTLEVESVVGKGSTFKLTFPAQKGDGG